MPGGRETANVPARYVSDRIAAFKLISMISSETVTGTAMVFIGPRDWLNVCFIIGLNVLFCFAVLYCYFAFQRSSHYGMQLEGQNNNLLLLLFNCVLCLIF